MTNCWRPYSNHLETRDFHPLPKIVSSHGCYIIDENGNEILDAISSWWCMAHGHSHSKIVTAIEKQLHTLPHIMFAGVTHEGAEKLASKLVEITEVQDGQVFFSDSGSTAVEVALKMAVQYFHNTGKIEKNKIVSLENSYHGDTMGAMSLANSENNEEWWKDFCPKQFQVKLPETEEDFACLENFLLQNKDRITAFIVEPLLQGAGGMIIYSAETLRRIYEIVKKVGDMLFIVDECATGFYRTGKLFAFQEAAGVKPDLIILGKALSGGHIAGSATVASAEVFEAFQGPGKAFMHGPTFMANPLFTAAALASIELFESEDYEKKVREIEKFFLEKCQEFKEFDVVDDVRVKGACLAISYKLQQGPSGPCYKAGRMLKDKALKDLVAMNDQYYNTLHNLRQKSIQDGILLRPFRNIIYTMPPLIITKPELEKIIEEMKMLINEIQ